MLNFAYKSCFLRPTKTELLHPFICMRNFIRKKNGNRKNYTVNIYRIIVGIV